MHYPGHVVSTRRHMLFLCGALLVPVMIAMAQAAAHMSSTLTLSLLMLSVAALGVGRRCWRFLESQEKAHTTPTPEMTFVFSLLVTVPMVLLMFVMMLAGQLGRN